MLLRQGCSARLVAHSTTSWAADNRHGGNVRKGRDGGRSPAMARQSSTAPQTLNGGASGEAIGAQRSWCLPRLPLLIPEGSSDTQRPVHTPLSHKTSQSPDARSLAGVIRGVQLREDVVRNGQQRPARAHHVNRVLHMREGERGASGWVRQGRTAQDSNNVRVPTPPRGVRRNKHMKRRAAQSRYILEKTIRSALCSKSGLVLSVRRAGGHRWRRQVPCIRDELADRGDDTEEDLGVPAVDRNDVDNGQRGAAGERRTWRLQRGSEVRALRKNVCCDC